jgi:hypothetical protein
MNRFRIYSVRQCLHVTPYKTSEVIQQKGADASGLEHTMHLSAPHVSA